MHYILLLAVSIFASLTATLYGQTIPRGYFSISMDFGFGPYGPGSSSRDEKQRALARELLGIHQVKDAGLFGHSIRLAFARTTKKSKLRWGFSLYRSWSHARLDTTYTLWEKGQPTNNPILVFEEFDLSDYSTYPNFFFEPRLWHNHKWTVEAHLSLGLGFYEDETVISPLQPGTVILQTRRLDDYGLVEIQNAYGIRTTFHINPFYSLFSTLRHNWQITSFTTGLVEASVGLELNIRKGGVER